MASETAERVWTGGRPLREALIGELAWRRPGMFSRELILESGSEQVAGLRWKKMFSFEAIAESADGRWIIGRKRSASLRGDHVVRDAESGAEVAGLERNWRGKGVARFVSGAEYRWECEGFWKPRYFWATGDRQPLITFREVIRFGRSYEMEVDPAARKLDELPILTLLGGYTMAMITAQRAAAS